MVLNLKGVKKSQVWDGKMKIFSMNYFRKKENEKSKAKKIRSTECPLGIDDQREPKSDTHVH